MTAMPVAIHTPQGDAGLGASMYGALASSTQERFVDGLGWRARLTLAIATITDAKSNHLRPLASPGGVSG